MVVDASIAASWLLPDELQCTSLADLGSSELHAPMLFWAETRNILVVSERRKRLSVDMLSEALSILDAIAVNLDEAPDGSRVIQLARSHQLTVYDALYVELALRLQTPFWTLDRKLAAAARREGVSTR
ncbi:MAG: type II toxin-antitoxin system VapC family toxin [Boseongicola sp. SB0662_bin_57]|nr:type II toxin-antitoxin system VapC family toxin [Boseongicola sp. SB0662_bin_57]